MKRARLYPDSGVELTRFTALHYDRLMNIASGGRYRKFIHRAIRNLEIMPDDTIIDLGCGTGRNAALMLDYLEESGKITGIDLSPIMRNQFTQRFEGEKRAKFLQQRIDIPFDLNEKADLIFISFVIHGFPHDVRLAIIENVKRHLTPGGTFAILDFAEFDMNKMPALHRWIFKTFECKYAHDFVEKDWKNILQNSGFTFHSEHFYMKNYVRLLKAILA
mgnify:FL=1